MIFNNLVAAGVFAPDCEFFGTRFIGFRLGRAKAFDGISLRGKDVAPTSCELQLVSDRSLPIRHLNRKAGQLGDRFLVTFGHGVFEFSPEDLYSFFVFRRLSRCQEARAQQQSQADNRRPFPLMISPQLPYAMAPRARSSLS
jgi:hypothetical protein